MLPVMKISSHWHLQVIGPCHQILSPVAMQMYSLWVWPTPVKIADIETDPLGLTVSHTDLESVGLSRMPVLSLHPSQLQ